MNKQLKNSALTAGLTVIFALIVFGGYKWYENYQANAEIERCRQITADMHTRFSKITKQTAPTDGSSRGVDVRFQPTPNEMACQIK